MDMPYTWFDALRTALGFLAIEELPDDERPKREIWLDAEAMKQHWAHVDRLRKKKFGNKDDDFEIDGPSEENALMKEWGLKK